MYLNGAMCAGLPSEDSDEYVFIIELVDICLPPRRIDENDKKNFDRIMKFHFPFSRGHQGV